MSEPRPIASLTGGLLARKGTARPAMRSPLQAYDGDDRGAPRTHGDDLGWNDFGHGHDPQAVGRVVSLADLTASTPVDTPVAPPAVVRQQQAIAGRLAAKPARQLAPAQAAPAQLVAKAKPAALGSRRNALAEGRRAAFTLRLDAERHLALRLAATLSGCSAQQIVTEALDRLIEQSPDIAAVAAQLRSRR